MVQFKASSFLLCFLSCFLLSNCQEASSLSKLDHFVKPPTSTLHTGGRLTERQIAYIAQAGYSSILSVVEFATNDTVYNGVIGSFPSSKYEVKLASSYGLTATYMVTNLTAASLDVVVDTIDSLKQPVYIHCHVGYTATLFTELYLYKKGIVTSASDVYLNGINYGYDYQANSDVVAFINSVTKSHDIVKSESIEQTLASGEASYKSYYWVHRAGHNDFWYNVGQVLDTQINAIKTAGYRSVISFRDDGEATNRLPSDPSTGAIDNNEFSNASGNYAVSGEKAAVEAAGMRFFHLPLTSGATNTWTVDQFALYAPVLAEAEALGPVLAHCASGYRSAVYVLAFLGSKSQRCTDWALSEARLIGLVFDNPSTQSATDLAVVSFFQEVLKC